MSQQELKGVSKSWRVSAVAGKKTTWEDNQGNPALAAPCKLTAWSWTCCKADILNISNNLIVCIFEVMAERNAGRGVLLLSGAPKQIRLAVEV